MRELLMKNQLSCNKRCHNIFFLEHFEKDGFIQDFERKTVCIIKDILEYTDTSDLKLFLSRRKQADPARQIYIVKSSDSLKGSCRLIYKMTGTHYVILRDKIYVFKVIQYVKKSAVLSEVSAVAKQK